MSDFEKGLADVMGSFMEINLDCVEKQNQEIEQLQQENQQLKEVIEEAKIYIEDSPNQMSEDATYYLLQILDKGVNE